MILQTLFDPIVKTALQEDLAGGDLSAEACIPDGKRARAIAIAKSPLVVCGADVFRRVFDLIAPGEVKFVAELAEGADASPPNAVVFRLEGPARALLMGERTALNFVQRMSGTATLARRLVRALPEGSATRITDTRKTTPGMRYLERYAVRVGGGYNHRDQLGSAVMIKDNHIIASGGITAAVERARARAPHTSRIEVEVTSLEQLDEAIAARADIIMLDNFSTPLTGQAVDRVRSLRPRPLLEASGGITLDRVKELAMAGVDVISVGALTHSAPAADISLDFEL